MGRGFSAHRSHSKRQTNKAKRSRSSSVLQSKKETVDIKPLQNHNEPKSDFTSGASFEKAVANVEASTSKRRGISSEKRAAEQLAAAGRTRSESIKKSVYLGNKKVRTVSVTRHFSAKKKKEGEGEEDDAANEGEGGDDETFEDFIDDEPSEDESETIRRPDVLTKYVEAGKVVDAVVGIVAAASVPGANTKELCELGDQEIFRRVGQLFKNATDRDAQSSSSSNLNHSYNGSVGPNARSRSALPKDRRYGVSNYERSMSRGPSSRGRSASSNPLAVRYDNGLPRGVSFPTTVSVNEILCNHTPFSDSEAVVLKPCDVVKIHLGVHVDGYPVSATRTIVVQPKEVAIGAGDESATVAAPLPPTAVNAIEAARVSLAGVIHLMRPGAVNDDITDFVASVGAHYDTEAVEGVLSTRTKRWVPDSVGSSIICRRITTENPQQDVAYCEVEPYQVWALDFAFTNSSSYKMQVPLIGNRHNAQCNIYRKNEIMSANPTLGDLRSKAASSFLTQEIRNKFHCFPFNPNHADEPLKARLALVALKKHGQIDAFDELACKPNSAYDSEGRICKKNPNNDNRAITARFSATVAVTEKRVHVLCGGVGIISDEFLSKKKVKDHKAATKAAKAASSSTSTSSSSSSADIGKFIAECGGLQPFEELYGACFPTSALAPPSAEFEKEATAPLFVRTPTDKLRGLLSSPLTFGKSVVVDDESSVATTTTTTKTSGGDADEDDNAEAARENLAVKRKHRRTEPTTDAAAAAAALTAPAPAVDAARKAKLASMHPGRRAAPKK